MTFRINRMTGYAPAEVKPTDAAWWFEKALTYKWTFAKTMPFAPHYYIWRGKEMSEPDYDRMFGALRTFGRPGKYWDRVQLYLVDPASGRRYWLMDRHWFTCTILNMADDGKEYGVQDAPITQGPNGHVWSEYDAIAPWWDDIYREADQFDLNALWKIATTFSHTPQPTLLDLGAGTGGSLDARFAASHRTTVVDPSTGMLNDLALKYPQVKDVRPQTVAEYLPNGRHHDIVAASFGSASYFTPEEIHGARDLSNELLLLSFYAVQPTHRTDLPPTHDEALQTAIALPGAKVHGRGSFVYVLVQVRDGT